MRSMKAIAIQQLRNPYFLVFPTLYMKNTANVAFYGYALLEYFHYNYLYFCPCPPVRICVHCSQYILVVICYDNDFRNIIYFVCLTCQ